MTDTETFSPYEPRVSGRTMNTAGNQHRTIRYVVTWLVGAIVGSCVTSRRDLVEDGKVCVESRTCPHVRIVPHAWNQAGNLVIHGMVLPASGAQLPVRGFIDVTIITPDGTTWGSRQADYRLGPSLRGVSSSGSFTVDFDGLPPTGSTVILEHSAFDHKLP